MFNLRSSWSGAEKSSGRTAVLAPPPRFRPELETIEDRTVPAQLLPADLVTITDVDLTGIVLNPLTGVLTATGGTVEGTLAGLPFTTDLSNFAIDLLPNLPATTPILDLELGPIDIDLLGAHVDTSRICLEITATPGGGLLGDLLSGLSLGTLTNVDDALEDILDGVLTGVLTNGGPPSGEAPDICDGENEILDLALGPVDLSLLGLNVSLDNCDDGPVQVCVSASEGEGILGDLLSGLAGGRRGLNLDINDITQIGSLATDLNQDGLSHKEEAQLSHLIRKLNK
jgi:hypothetical protein